MVSGTVDVDFSAIDQTALMMVFVGVAIVFLSLICIYLFFKYLLPVMLKVWVKRKIHRLGHHNNSAKISEIPGDVNAAIAMALYLYFSEIHDEESNVITIKRVSRTYSPWSSKLYNMRNLR